MTLYDDHPYHSRAFSFAHPDRLHVIAKLFGLTPAAVQSARILEIGCASGGHLWPMAMHLPEAEVVGVDMSEVQIEQGMEMVEALEIEDRLSFRWADIMELTDELGTYDYVIAHGFYSWVPPEVAEKLMSLINTCLADNGVALVSYNCFPGWGMKMMTSQMMKLHTQGITEDATEKIGQARGLMDFLAGTVDQDEAYGQLMIAEQQAIMGTGDHVMFHGRLAEHNHPCWLRDFNLCADRNGLQYLGDVDLATMMPDTYGPDVGEALEGVSDDIVVLEQYLDFIGGRSFRRSLLVKADAKPDRNVTPDRLEGMYVSGRVWATSDIGDVRTDDPVSFQAMTGAAMEVGDPLMKAMLLTLGAISPATISLDALVTASCELIGRNPKPERKQAIAANLIPLFTHRVIELSPRPLPIAATMPDKPEATLLSRLQAEMGVEVTTLRHDPQTLKPFDRALLQELNGEKTDVQLAEWLEPEGGLATIQERLEALRKSGLILG